MRRAILTAIVVLSAALTVSGQGGDIHCPVLRIIDGDTIDILTNSVKLRIRFDGVDCPESGQTAGADARDFTTRLLKDKIVTVRLLGAHENRIIGRVFVDGRDVSMELVRAGMAWHYMSFSKDKVLAELEKDARARKMGLWRNPDPMPPWEYRRYVQKTKTVSPVGPFHGNTDSRIFHRPGCAYYKCATCTRKFTARDEAIKAGYKPCKVCKP
jgi:micrococcal nuclease